jgi:hypothetical protein
VHLGNLFVAVGNAQLDNNITVCHHDTWKCVPLVNSRIFKQLGVLLGRQCLAMADEVPHISLGFFVPSVLH